MDCSRKEPRGPYPAVNRSLRDVDRFPRHHLTTPTPGARGCRHIAAPRAAATPVESNLPGCDAGLLSLEPLPILQRAAAAEASVRGDVPAPRPDRRECRAR